MAPPSSNGQPGGGGGGEKKAAGGGEKTATGGGANANKADAKKGPAGDAFRVKDISGKGRGLIAARNIEIGKLLLDEEPLVLGLSQSAMAVASLTIAAAGVLAWAGSLYLQASSGQLTFDLPALRGVCCLILFVFLVIQIGGMIVEGFVVFWRVRLLGASDRAAYFNLCDTLPFYIPILSEAFIFRANAVSTDWCGCVCAVAALVNHACVPSAILSWNTETGRHQVRALRGIKAEEEIAVSYIDLWQPTVARQHSLRRAMRFSCACNTCMDSTEESVRRLSDHRRTACSQLERGITEKMENGQLEEAMKDLQILRDVTEQELGGVDNLISRDMDEAIKDIQAQIKNSEAVTNSEMPSEQTDSCNKRGSCAEE